MNFPSSKYFAHSLIVFILTLILSTWANADNWTQKRYAHYANNEPVVELLQQFASSIDTPIIISEEVKGVVSGKFEETSARKFLDDLSRVHSLIWYHDGLVLYVYHAKEITTSVVNLKAVSSKRLLAALNNLGILDNRYSFKSIDSEGIVLLSGVPRYIELVKNVADMIVSSHVDKSNDEFVVRVFELKYAWADDRDIYFNGQQTKAPGVASTLQSILGKQLPVNSITLSPQRKTISKLKGQGLAHDRYSENQEQGDNAPLVVQNQVVVQNQAGEAYIVANERLNAVIVYDRISKMPLYEDLIASLDIAKNQVEIEVSIIDVSTDKLQDMGVEWQVNGSKGSFATSDFSNGALPRDTNELSLLLGSDVNFSTILDSTQDFFLTRIRMLSENGDATVLSQPTVLTLDNNEATLDHSTTFFVRLTGEREVDLFPVSVGSVLRVTPHIIAEQGQNKIRLDINIEDGQQTGATVDDIPSISKSIIKTQALINDNGSLLVGGYYYNHDSISTSKVPLLGDIPLLGWLFTSESKQYQKTARLFLITPRVVTSELSDVVTEKVSNFITDEQLSLSGKLDFNHDRPRANKKLSDPKDEYIKPWSW